MCNYPLIHLFTQTCTKVWKYILFVMWDWKFHFVSLIKNTYINIQRTIVQVSTFLSVMSTVHVLVKNTFTSSEALPKWNSDSNIKQQNMKKVCLIFEYTVLYTAVVLSSMDWTVSDKRDRGCVRNFPYTLYGAFLE